MISEPIVSLIAVTPDAESLIARAARTCYASNRLASEDRDATLVHDCVRRGHESVLEHANATFEITGSRVLTHELVRHRIAAYSQRSQRYVKENDDSFFFLPPEIAERADESARAVYDAAMTEAFRAYRELLARGVSKQIARYVLPNACLTTIVATWNFREIRHVVRLRAGKEAQPEFRAVASEVLRLMVEVAPNTFADLAEALAR
jgi:thymidylate synthase (FAD)